MMKHLTMKLIMMKIWGLAVGSCWVLPVGVCREHTASRIGCVFLFFGRYFYFHDFGPKIMLWLFLYFYTPSGQINSEKIILQKHLAVFLLVTMVSQQIIIITSVQSLCLADSGEHILLVSICFETRIWCCYSPSPAWEGFLRLAEPNCRRGWSCQICS